MTTVIAFPGTRLTFSSSNFGASCCIGCGSAVEKRYAYRLEVNGNRPGEKRKVDLCQDCHEITPAWVWAAK